MSEPRTYIVSGGGGGIGGAVVARLLKETANVAAVDISRRRLAAIEGATAGLPGRLVTFSGDVTDEHSAEALVQSCLERFGSLHGLANVTGGMVGITEGHMDRPFADISLADFRQTYILNVESAFLMTKAAYPHFSAQRYGKVVNVASLAAFANRPDLGNAAYDPAKAAVIGLTRSLSRSLGKDGIRVNVIAPGLILSDRVVESFGPEIVDRHLAITPLGELATTDDAAELISFLLEPRSDRVTGEVIRMSAGLR